MLNGKLEGQDIGSGTAVWQLPEPVKAGEITVHEFIVGRGRHVAFGRHLQDDGHGLDHGLHGRGAGRLAAAQRGDSRRSTRGATCWPTLSGIRIVEMVQRGLALSKILTREAFENAIRVNAAIGGSTNAVVHLKAIAGRIGVDLDLEDWTRIGRGTPTLVDLMPSGRFLMEEFYYAGGLPAVLRRLGERGLLPHPGRAHRQRQATLGDSVRGAPMLQRRGDPPAATARWSPTAASASCAATWRRAARC